MRFFRMCFAVLVLVPAVVRGQSATASAKAFFQAHGDKQWMAMADLVDSASLRVIRIVANQLTTTLATASSPRVRATMDSAGASGMVAAMDGLRSLLGGSLLQFSFAHVANADELLALSNRELMSRWFEAKSFAYLGSLMSGTLLKPMMGKLADSANAGIQSAFDAMQNVVIGWEVIGEIAEGDTLRHVAYRVAGSTPRGAAGVLTFVRRPGARWLVTFTNPDDQLGHMAALGNAALQSLAK